MKRSRMIVAAALFALAGCDKTSTETKPEDPASKNGATTAVQPTASASASALAAAEPAIAESDLATPADFEQAAETSITKANYKPALTALETDIAKE